MSARTALVAFHEDVPGGATLSALRTFPHLQEHGWRFVLWAPDPSPLAEYLREHGYEVRGAPRPIAYSLQAMRLEPGLRRRLMALPGYLNAFRRAISDVKPDLIHANSLFTLAEAGVARALRVPVLFHVHEMRPAGRKGELGVGAVWRVGSEVVAVSGACADELSLPGRRPEIVYEGAIVPSAARPEPPAPIVVGSVGVVSTRKGSDLFVEAARLVGEVEPEVRFELVGSPTDELERDWAGELLSRAAAIGIAHEPRADVPAKLASWTIFALPSRRDPFPISMLEAMGHGLPCVGTDIDGISEQLSDGAGELVPGDDAQALADAILRLARDPELRASLGAAAREKVVGGYSVEVQAERLGELYERAVRR